MLAKQSLINHFANIYRHSRIEVRPRSLTTDPRHNNRYITAIAVTLEHNSMSHLEQPSAADYRAFAA